VANSNKTEELLDPVDAYNRVAPQFTRLSALRRLYLEQVERVIISEIPAGKHSLLDVGAGDGRRSKRIAAACGLDRLVLLEPSAAMRGNGMRGAEIWPIRAEELGGIQAEFDVIVCLWNVLGHIGPAERRKEVLRQFTRLSAMQGGLVFIDVNHRYNVLEYGVLPTAGRFLHDMAWRSERNGDVRTRWNSLTTTGHVFTDREVRSLATNAGLAVKKRFVIDYATGKIRKRSFCGNLLYVLARA
jgi:ubiquinone/menaquinone biosynthesis C-methylase UbiE